MQCNPNRRKKMIYGIIRYLKFDVVFHMLKTVLPNLENAQLIHFKSSMRLNHQNEIQYFLNTWYFHYHFIIILIVIIIITNRLFHILSQAFPVEWEIINRCFGFWMGFWDTIYNESWFKSFKGKIERILKQFNHEQSDTCIQWIKWNHRYNQTLMLDNNNAWHCLHVLELVWSDMFTVQLIDPKIFDLQML